MNRILARAVGSSLVAVLSFTVEPLWAQQASDSSSGQQQQPAQHSTSLQNEPANQNQLPPVELPENPGSTVPSQPPPASQPAPTPQTSGPQPGGTAVAPPVEVSGGAASKPAGVAIAPPKQRQIRSLLLRLGLIAGAGVAVGTVVGLSAASPGHVPNSPGH